MKPRTVERQELPGSDRGGLLAYQGDKATGNMLVARGKAMPAWYGLASTRREWRERNGRVRKVRLATERSSARKGTRMVAQVESWGEIVATMERMNSELLAIRDQLAKKPRKAQTRKRTAAQVAEAARIATLPLAVARTKVHTCPKCGHQSKHTSGYTSNGLAFHQAGPTCKPKA